MPPPPVPQPTKPVTNTQPNPTKAPPADTKSLLNTLAKLKAEQKDEAPKAPANPTRGGAPKGGGNPKGDATDALTAAQRGAIGDKVRECWGIDTGAKGIDQMQVLLDVTTDANGTARVAQFDPSESGRMNDPVFRAFAERARRAVLDPQCAKFPLPSAMLGQVQTFKFRFSP